MIRLMAGVLVVGAAIYLATGLAIVQQDEVGIERRFGAAGSEPLAPGLHWGLPWGLGQIDRVKTGQTRSLTVGAQALVSAPLTRNPDPARDDFLTGDLNLATTQVIVQYRVADPRAYLFAATSADEALALAAEAALTRALAERGIDDVLTTGRASVADRLRGLIQRESDRQGLGITVAAVRLGRVAPPVPVADAFADAARARSDARQAITAAEEYRDRAQADASGMAREIADGSQAEHDRAVTLARGEAERFTRVLAESRKDLDATRQRLYLEALAELLPRFSRKVVVAPGQELDLSLFSDEVPAVSDESGR